MELWTKKEDQFCWRQWPDIVQGLASLCDAKPGSLLLLAEQPNEEIKSLLAAVTLAKKLTGDTITIIVASPCPANTWISSSKERGIDHIWVIGRTTRSKITRLDTPRHLEVPKNVCPALHARASQKVTLSVCGRHRDWMVLARHHHQRWCLCHHQDCPHWRKDTR